MAHPEDPEDFAGPSELLVQPGSLLIAATDMTEPTFRRTVVYIIEHDESGSLGVVLNRPSDTAVLDILPRWADIVAKPQAFYIGGPVKRDAALCLGVLKPGLTIDGLEGIRLVQGRVVMVDLDAEPDSLMPVLEGIRVFVGYSGWMMGQLKGELDRNDWMVVPGLAADVIAPARTDLWGRVLRRQPLPQALLATHPIEVERN